MLTIVLRSIIIYVIVIFLYRLMGKRQLGEMQPFDLVLTLIIADLATIPMADVSVPVLHGVIPLFTLAVFHYILTQLSKFSTHFSHFLSGKPVIVINPQGIDQKALKNLDISVDDVFEAIRGCGFFKIQEVQYAIMETNGKMTVLPKGEFAPATVGDLNLQVQPSEIPINIIAEGKVNKNNLRLSTLDEVQLGQILKTAGAKRVKDVLILSIDKGGEVFVQLYQKKYQTFQIPPLGKLDE